jgi:hypothetical protein
MGLRSASIAKDAMRVSLAGPDDPAGRRTA